MVTKSEKTKSFLGGLGSSIPTMKEDQSVNDRIDQRSNLFYCAPLCQLRLLVHDDRTTRNGKNGDKKIADL